MGPYKALIAPSLCRIEKNTIMLSPYSMLEVDKLGHDDFFKILNINHIFNIICPSAAKHIQSHIPNNYKVINKIKMSCNTLCPCISSVGDHY